MFRTMWRASTPFAASALCLVNAYRASAETAPLDKDMKSAAKWDRHFSKANEKKFMILASPGMERFAEDMVKKEPDRFIYHVTKWEKFPDGTDKIELGGFKPVNRISGQHIIFLSNFYNNDVTLSQFSAMIVLLQSLIKSLTVVLPFYPVGTMERVIVEGEVATANTYAQMLSNMPSCGQPMRLLVYDLHTLQNRFYLHGNSIASLQTTIPVLLDRLKDTDIDCIAFPDDGAAKRFSMYFKNQGYEIVTCGKVRDGDKRKIIIQDGNAVGRNVLVVDDLVQTGGTLHECGVALMTVGGANKVSAFVAHGVFPGGTWRRFLRSGEWAVFDKFYLTNSVPTVVAGLPRDDVFEVLDLTQKIIDDIANFSS